MGTCAAFVTRLDSMAATDLSWFAGWLCADGCIGSAGVHKPGRRPTHLVSIKFTLTDKDVLDRFSLMFGGSVAGPNPPRGLGKKDTWYWGTSGDKAIALLQAVDLWLSDRYRMRAHAAAAAREQFPRGRKLSAEDKHRIILRLSQGVTGRDLASEYGVSNARISQLKLRGR